MSRHLHSHIDVAGMAAHDDSVLRQWRKAFKFDGEYAPTVRALRARLIGLLGSGVRYLPCGEPCDGWTDEKGCPGHESAS